MQLIFEKIMSKKEEGALWEKKVSSTFKKSSPSKVEFTSEPCTVNFPKNNLLKNKKRFGVTGASVEKKLLVNDLRNLQKLKIYGLFLFFVPTTEYLLRLSHKIRAATFAGAETVWISPLP